MSPPTWIKPQLAALASKRRIPARALLLAERLDTRTLERDGALAVAPLVVAVKGGC